MAECCACRATGQLEAVPDRPWLSRCRNPVTCWERFLLRPRRPKWGRRG